MEEACSGQHEVVVAVRLALVLEPAELVPPHVPRYEADNVGGMFLPCSGRKLLLGVLRRLQINKLYRVTRQVDY